MVATGSLWFLQDASGCYRKVLAATGRYWLLQEAAGYYSKLLVVPEQLSYDNNIRHRKLQDAKKKLQEGTGCFKKEIINFLL